MQFYKDETEMKVLEKLIEANEPVTVTLKPTDIMTLHSTIVDSQIVYNLASKGLTETHDGAPLEEIVADYYSDSESSALGLLQRIMEQYK